MSEINNPAGRLQTIVESGRGQPKDHRAFQVWPTILGIEERGKSDLLRHVGSVMTLPADIQEQIKQIGGIDHDLFLRWAPKVESAFSALNLQSRWGQFIDKFDGEVMYGIELCSHTLSQNSPQTNVDHAQVGSLLLEVNELLNEVVNSSNINAHLRRFIIGRLRDVRIALEEYQVLGSRAIEKEVEALIGAITRRPDLWKESRKTTVGDKFWRFMGRVAVVMTISVGTIQIGSNTVNMLSNPEQDDTFPHEGRASDETQEV